MAARRSLTLRRKKKAPEAPRVIRAFGTPAPAEARRRTICFVLSAEAAGHALDHRPSRYRCFHWAEALQAAGHIVTVAPLGTFLTAPNPDFEVYIFHRPSMADERLRTVLTALKKLKKTIIADLDEFVFGSERPSDQAQALGMFDKITLNTHALSDAVRAHVGNLDLHVTPDALPPSLAGMYQVRQCHLEARPPGALCYIAPEDGNGMAFRRIWDVVYKVLSEDEDASLTCFGELDAPDVLTSHPRVFFRPRELPVYRTMTLAEFGCVLAPLLPGDHSRCASRADYIETTLAGARYICSPFPDLPPLRQANLKTAITPSDWYEQLVFAVETPIRQEEITSCVERTFEARSTSRTLNDFVNFLEHS